MIQSPQVEPISSLRRNHVAIMGKLKNGPVFLAQRGNLAAALVSITEWDEIAQHIRELQEQLERERRLRLSNQRYAAMMADASQMVSQEEFDRQLAEAGLT